MAENSVGTPASFTTLLGRNFKMNPCDADPKFVAKVLKRQKVNSNTAMRNPEDSQDDEDMDSCAENLSDNVVESDGACLSVAKLKKKKIQPKPSRGGNAPDIPQQPVKTHDFDVQPTENNGNSNSLEARKEYSECDEEETMKGGIEDVPGSQSLSEISTPSVSREITHEESQPDAELYHDDSVDLDQSSSGLPVSVSGKKSLEDYSRIEWKGTTAAAEQMRLGYSEVITATDCASMRKIRGDNYCGLRATSFQILSQNLNVLISWKNLKDIISIPKKLIKGCTWLTQWSFANRLEVTQKKKIETMQNCLNTLCKQIEIARSFRNKDALLKHFMQYFNSESKDEILLFEALKILMLHTAVKLYSDIEKSLEVPVFSQLLFARDTSETPEKLMKNHLNTVGDTGGLEQVEMCLLGYALNLTIRVVRPSKVGQEDFMTNYPEDHVDEWDMCNLLAEDDRHYNIIVE